MATQGRSLKARALSFLARREHSRQELAAKLARHEEDPALIEQTLDELAAGNWLSDTRFASEYVRSMQRKFGSGRIRQQLRQRGIDADAAGIAVESLDDLATAAAIWQRKYGAQCDGQPLDAATRAKQIRFLQSRGFSLETALAAVRQGTSGKPLK